MNDLLITDDAQPDTPACAASIQPIGISASRKIAKNISAITPRKKTQPQTRCVNQSSSRSLTVACAELRACCASVASSSAQVYRA